MTLNKTQEAIIEKAKAAGGGELGIGLGDEACNFLIATIAKDLSLYKKFPEFPKDIPNFFSPIAPKELEVGGINFRDTFEKLVKLVPDADTYFSCLASLHKSRLKFAKILEAQPLPTMDQIGPRSLLQFGILDPISLANFLVWRKWIFDIDNRAAQETGYLFEPIIAYAIGGVPFSARKSPIRRRSNASLGRQVDCVRGTDAYEIKIRVTIAASGQGRWKEELEFPVDCKHSGYTPVLVVLDPTPNQKLAELEKVFKAVEGRTYIGDAAWHHLESLAGKTMGIFLEKYVRQPMQETLENKSELPLNISFRMREGFVDIQIEDKTYSFERKVNMALIEEDLLPDDVDEEVIRI
ncbi:hypothetical protein A2963_04925 [Candidatus Roizmanbacteria bacterium RIFCSPLOWO2_01_FULL_40_13]|nr:MAG: hypothetical protein A2963_04925 [Candidatus Roizmanbacteria bacterium RIFCSPLOWO2_01_FULL_40_13]